MSSQLSRRLLLPVNAFVMISEFELGRDATLLPVLASVLMGNKFCP
jgi:hypothetical protein